MYSTIKKIIIKEIGEHEFQDAHDNFSKLLSNKIFREQFAFLFLEFDKDTGHKKLATCKNHKNTIITLLAIALHANNANDVRYYVSTHDEFFSIFSNAGAYNPFGFVNRFYEFVEDVLKMYKALNLQLQFNGGLLC